MTPTICDWCCKSPITSICAKRDASYCSVSCRDKDANVHKIICQGSKDFREQHPRSVVYLGLLLPHDRLAPEFTWVKFKQQEVAGLLHEQPDLSEHVLRDRTDRKTRFKNITIACDANKDSDNDRIEIIGAETKIGDGLKENICLTDVVGGNEQYSWRGPILVLRRKGLTSYSDVQGSDLQMLRKYFTDRMSRKRKRNDDTQLACNFKDSRLNASSGFKAVMISSAGDMKEFGHAKFSQVTINDGPVLSKLFAGPRTCISDRLGFMLEFYQYDSGIVSNSWEGLIEQNALEHCSNPEIHTLLTEAHLCYLWGTTGGSQESVPGSFVVVRADRRALHPYHIEALERFIAEVVLPAMQAVIENCRTGQIPFGKQGTKKNSMAAKYITKDRFETFFSEYKKLKIEDGYESWAKVKSPFST